MPLIHESFIYTILELYSEKTKTPIAFVYNNKIYWQESKSYCSEYCNKIMKLLPGKCHEDHLKRARCEEKLTMCHAGLWNYVVPIKFGGNTVGALLTGQRRLKFENYRSNNRLLELKNRVPEKYYLELEESYYNTPIIENFDVKYLETLELIEERVLESLISLKNTRKKALHLAHLFLLPIQSIIANAENICYELGNEEEEELKVIVQELIQQVQKLGMIAENMRFSMINEDEKYIFENKNIMNLLIEINNIFKGEALKNKIIIRDPIFVGANPPILPISYSHLNRCFFNLIHNAVKYSYRTMKDQEKNRYIETLIIEKNKYYIIVISNYGVGILDDEIKGEKIFEEGYRGKLSKDRNRTGSGIGLSEAKKIIAKHSGKIYIKSVLQGTNKYSGPYKNTILIKLPKSH